MTLKKKTCKVHLLNPEESSPECMAIVTTRLQGMHKIKRAMVHEGNCKKS